MRNPLTAASAAVATLSEQQQQIAAAAAALNDPAQLNAVAALLGQDPVELKKQLEKQIATEYGA